MSYFGTDGIRRKSEIFTAEFLRLFSNGVSLLPSAKKVALARDTRLSGPYIEKCLISFLNNAGIDVIGLGIVPSPCLALCTEFLGCDYGIMVSASHNLPPYNGLKIFLSDGSKATENEEKIIENYISDPFDIPEKTGKYFRADGLQIYLISLKNAPRLDGMKIYLDCARGAAVGFAPTVFRTLGADVTYCDDLRKGINVECGAEHAENLLSLSEKYDACFAFDGDADRVKGIINGKIYDGDGIMYCLALNAKENGTLPNNAVCGTVMTNSGYESAYKAHGIDLFRTDVGDKSVYAEMKKRGVRIGGEKSGHVIIRDVLKTGDGIRTAIEFAALIAKGKASCDVAEVPSFTDSLTVTEEEKAKFRSVAGNGIFERKNGIRTVIRASGTEPIIRFLAETEDKEYGREILLSLKKEVVRLLR